MHIEKQRMCESLSFGSRTGVCVLKEIKSVHSQTQTTEINGGEQQNENKGMLGLKGTFYLRPRQSKRQKYNRYKSSLRECRLKGHEFSVVPPHFDREVQV